MMSEIANDADDAELYGRVAQELIWLPLPW
jgi:hypothetical protein